jgi:hypothetical protein
VSVCVQITKIPMAAKSALLKQLQINENCGNGALKFARALYISSHPRRQLHRVVLAIGLRRGSASLHSLIDKLWAGIPSQNTFRFLAAYLSSSTFQMPNFHTSLANRIQTAISFLLIVFFALCEVNIDIQSANFHLLRSA